MGRARHELGRADRDSVCARVGCTKNPKYGFKSCDMLFCMPRCMSSHINNRCAHTNQRKHLRKWKWEEDSDDSDDVDWQEGDDESGSGSESWGSQSGGDDSGDDGDSLSE